MKDQNISPKEFLEMENNLEKEVHELRKNTMEFSLKNQDYYKFSEEASKDLKSIKST